MIFSKKSSFFIATIFLSALLTGCGNSDKVLENADSYTLNVQEMDIPDDIKVIGLGEATHGNIELQELKRDVFEVLITKENVHVFVLEGDFGGGQQINQFILNGTGTAEDAVNALDYNIYRTEQMIHLIQWMHDYNLTVNEAEKIYFYGNDMQRYDFSKKELLNYYKVVNAEEVKKIEEQLEYASNETMRELTGQQLEEINTAIDQIILDLQSNEGTYVEQTSPDDFSFALQYAQIMKQRTQLFLNERDYAHLRDQYLADNLQWIIEFEATRGHDKVFFSGHNGHVEKTSASLAGYKSMGNYLDELYGSQYFAIGTELMNSEFQALNRKSAERQNFNIENHNNLVNLFAEVESNVFYVGFDQASESEKLLEMISSDLKMVNIGDDFSPWYTFLKMFYTIEMVPKDAYDGIIFIKKATPTTVIE